MFMLIKMLMLMLIDNYKADVNAYVNVNANDAIIYANASYF